MGLLDALSGRIGHFNEIVVPTHKEISERIRNLEDRITAVLLMGVLDLIALKTIDYFFNPKKGSLLSVVKNYTAEDIRKLYAVLMTWSVIDFINLGCPKENIKQPLQQALNYSDSDFANVWRSVEHDVVDLRKLYGEIAGILKIDSTNEEGYLAFHINYSKIAKEGMDELGKYLELS